MRFPVTQAFFIFAIIAGNVLALPVNPFSFNPSSFFGASGVPSIPPFFPFTAISSIASTSSNAPTVTLPPSSTSVASRSSITSISLPTVSASTPTPTTSDSESSQLTSTPTPTGTSTSTSTPIAPSTTLNLGAIVGGTVGGGIALVAVIVSLWFFCLRNKKAPVNATVQNHDVFPYKPVPARPNEVLAQIARSGKFNSPNTMSNTNITTARLTPIIPDSESTSSQQFDFASASTTSGRNRSTLSNNVDVRALAQELAAEFYRNYSPDLRGQISELQNHDDTNTSPSNHQPPPNYREATGPSSSVSSPGST